MSIINQFTKDCVTTKDGESYDVGRVLWVLGAIAFLGLTVYVAISKGVFDTLNFGAGYAGILGGGGAGLALKSKTEPDA